MSWEPGQYLKYASERLRPALDLAARIGLAAPRNVVDLGCGAGNVTRILVERWPDAHFIGVDNSAEMLDKARESSPPGARIEWRSVDLAAWAAEATPRSIDLVFSNAALHWLDGHAELFPRLMGIVGRGGVLAVQMPSNFHAPSHVVLNEVARSARWRSRLGAPVRPVPVAPVEDYFAWLSPHADTVDAWTTEYLHVLPPAREGDHPVIGWVKGTSMTPFLAALDAEAQQAFIHDCAEEIARAYPALPDGRVPYPFRRVFLVVTRGNR
jgi:trans-aconitate 2-methyltransferase